MRPVGTTVGVLPTIERVDGRAKVTGSAHYVDDLHLPGELVGQTVRSRVPHGVLRSLRRDPAFDWSDVVVVMADDIPGRNVITLIEDDQPALVPLGGEVRHAEQALALVAAPDRHRAREAAAHLQVDVDPRPGVFDIEQSLAAELILHGTDNVFSRLQILRGDEIEAALARCDHVIEGLYRTGAQEQMYIEPQGMLAHWEGDCCHVTGSMQCPYYIHPALMTLFDLPAHKVVVRQAVTGGGFGGKEEYPSMLAAHAALLSAKAGRPVKLIYDRSEDIAATTKRHPARIRHRLGFDAGGKLRAADIDVVIDAGAYITLSPVVLSRAVLHAAGPYAIPHVRVCGRAVATNTPPHGAFRGFGAPQTLFACERQMNRAARRLGLDPLAFRRDNALREGDRTSTGQLLQESVGSLHVLDVIAAAARERGEADARPLAAGRVPPVACDEARGGVPPSPGAHVGAGSARIASSVQRGRGVAFCLHGAGFTGSGEARLKGRAAVATLADGGFEVRSSSTDIGQGTSTIFMQIAASALGVPAARVRVCEPRTDRVPDSGPTVASRTTMVVGAVVERAAAELRAELLAFAGQRGLATDDLCELARAHHAEHGEACHTVVHQPAPDVHWDDASYTGSAYPVYGWAACLVDVAVDQDTLEVTVERCVHAVDVGRAIHPQLVRGQIEGGTVQALGWALLESVPYRDGRVANPSMTDCIIPTSFDVPELETHIVEVPWHLGPGGAKGLGEIPMDGPAAALANAIEDALGLPVDELPALPEKLAQWLAQAEEKG